MDGTLIWINGNALIFVPKHLLLKLEPEKQVHTLHILKKTVHLISYNKYMFKTA